MQFVVDHEQRCDADRHVDKEDPAPAGDAQDLRLTSEEAANDRTQHAGGAEDREEVTLVLGALSRRHDVADDGQSKGEESTGAQTLDGTQARQHWHRGGE